MSAQEGHSEYRVELPTYRGPLDLLLYLVKKHEVDILDIPIATIVTSYLRYLELIQLIDVDAAGDFLVMASTLMEIKSRMMLPASKESDSDDGSSADQKVDPRAELVKQLVAYRRYREAADDLQRLAAEQASRWPRGFHEKPAGLADPKQQPLQQVELWDLVSAFDRLMRATLTNQGDALSYDETPLQVHMAQLLDLLRRANGPVAFENCFQPPHTKGRLIGLFLALLELIKLHEINVEQEQPFAMIYVSLCQKEAETSQTLLVVNS
jgi:segregation and condensation protein A